jgi:threonine-phosphate decarboxylase
LLIATASIPQLFLPATDQRNLFTRYRWPLGPKRALILGPTYADYADACSMHNIHFEYFIAQESQAFKADIDMIKSR